MIVSRAMHKRAYRLATVIMVPLLVAVPFVVTGKKVEAADLGFRSLTMITNEPSVTASHQLEFGYITAGAVGSIEVEYCQNDPFPGDPCTVPTGIDATGVVLSSEIGETGFSIHGSTTANRIVLTRVPAAVSVFSPALSTYLLSNIVNPDTVGTLFARVSTFAADDGTGARTDDGGLALALEDSVNVGLFVPPVLQFCIGTTIPTTSCASTVGDGIDFGDFDTASTSAGTTQMLAGTNALTGYTITATGTTITSGNNPITAMPAGTSSQTNTSQFGLNLRNNTVPNVGLNTSGQGVGTPAADYNVPDQFKFLSGDVIARSLNSTHLNLYTVSYIVNIDGNQKPGIYATTLTFTALAGF